MKQQQHLILDLCLMLREVSLPQLTPPIIILHPPPPSRDQPNNHIPINLQTAT